MEAYLLDWVNSALRWVACDYRHCLDWLVFLLCLFDNNLLKPNSPDLLEKGVDGAMWAVHGGGFYNPQKYMVAPKQNSHQVALVLLGKLFVLADWLCALHSFVFMERQHLT
jgi:uncharacterized membrane protein